MPKMYVYVLEHPKCIFAELVSNVYLLTWMCRVSGCVCVLLPFTFHSKCEMVNGLREMGMSVNVMTNQKEEEEEEKREQDSYCYSSCCFSTVFLLVLYRIWFHTTINRTERKSFRSFLLFRFPKESMWTSTITWKMFEMNLNELTGLGHVDVAVCTIYPSYASKK